MICCATSSVAENEEHYRRQRPHEECYPKPKPARSSALPSHLRGNRDRRNKNDENENRPRVHLTVSNRHRYLNRRKSAFPARLLNSFASSVPSLSGSAALKRFSTTARNSSLVSVPSWSGSAASSSFADNRPANSRLSSVPSWSPSRLSNHADAAFFASVRSTVPSLSVSNILIGLACRGFGEAGSVPTKRALATATRNNLRCTSMI